MADLQLAISNADDLAVSQLCSLAHLDQTGSLDSRKERLRSFLAGPPRRHRSGWLRFFLHVVGSGAVGAGPAFEVDYDDLDHADQDILADYIQFYHLGGAFLRAPPVDILADLQVSANEDDSERDYDFAVPDGYTWPAREAIDKLTGAAASASCSMANSLQPSMRSTRRTAPTTLQTRQNLVNAHAHSSLAS